MQILKISLITILYLLNCNITIAQDKKALEAFEKAKLQMLTSSGQDTNNINRPLQQKTSIFSSSLGYSIELPADWITISRDSVAKNPNLLNSSDSNFIKLDTIIQQKVLDNIKSGKCDFYIKKAFSDKFPPRINITKHTGILPQNRGELLTLCDNLKIILRNATGEDKEIHTCCFTETNRKQAIYLKFDGIVQNTSTVQYMIPVSDFQYISITANYKYELSDDGSKWIDISLWGEINAIMESVQIN